MPKQYNDDDQRIVTIRTVGQVTQCVENTWILPQAGDDDDTATGRRWRTEQGPLGAERAALEIAADGAIHEDIKGLESIRVNAPCLPNHVAGIARHCLRCCCRSPVWRGL